MVHLKATRVLAAPCVAMTLALTLALAGCDRGADKAEAPKAEKGVIGLSEPSLKYLTIEAVSASEPASTYGPIPGRVALRPEAVQSLGAPTAALPVCGVALPRFEIVNAIEQGASTAHAASLNR